MKYNLASALSILPLDISLLSSTCLPTPQNAQELPFSSVPQSLTTPSPSLLPSKPSQYALPNPPNHLLNLPSPLRSLLRSPFLHQSPNTEPSLTWRGTQIHSYLSRGSVNLCFSSLAFPTSLFLPSPLPPFPPHPPPFPCPPYPPPFPFPPYPPTPFFAPYFPFPSPLFPFSLFPTSLSLFPPYSSLSSPSPSPSLLHFHRTFRFAA